MSNEHKHSFAVDAACDCGLMISDIVRGLQAEVAELRAKLAATEDQVYAERYKAHTANEQVAALREQNERLDAKLTKLARHHENEVAAARVEGLREALNNCSLLPPDVDMLEQRIAALERGKTEG